MLSPCHSKITAWSLFDLSSQVITVGVIAVVLACRYKLKQKGHGVSSHYCTYDLFLLSR